MNLNEKRLSLPNQSGCYLMKNKEMQIIYVGKAKNLKNRVNSYFTGSHDTKTTLLVNEITDFDFILTQTEKESLILENNLIKKHKPKYNILLKDDKRYPYLKITNEKHPRILVVRQVKKDGGKYFGPFPNHNTAYGTKDLLDRLYPLRKCNVMPKKVCLYYHIGQCLAPCEFHVSDSTNQQMVKEISRFLNGDISEVKKELTLKMSQASESMEFEKAKEYRDLIHSIENLKDKQHVEFSDLVDRDVFGISYHHSLLSIQIFYIRKGLLIERETFVHPYVGNVQDAFSSFFVQFYHHQLVPKEILIPEEFYHEIYGDFFHTRVSTPKRGAKKKLMDLATANSKQKLSEKMSQDEIEQIKTSHLMNEISSLLGIPAPKRIEMFDNSNIQGTSSVGAMVTFIDGKPSKNDYRKYKIKTVHGADDYATFREVISRRLQSIQEGKLPVPDLLVVDGGKGQMSAAHDSLKEYGYDIPLLGLSKNEKHKTDQVWFGYPPKEIPIHKKSELFYFFVRMQDEVHRFAISYFNHLRNKQMKKSVLDEIDGVGEKTKQKLLKEFGSLKKMKEASLNEFKKLGIRETVAKRILDSI